MQLNTRRQPGSNIIESQTGWRIGGEMRGKLLWGTICVASLWGCASPPPPEQPASESEKQTASHAYLACMFDNATKIDDQVSDAGTVAKAIDGVCSEQFSAMVVVAIRGEDNAAASAAIEVYRQGKIGIATNVVLRERQLRRTGKQPKSD